MLSYGEILLNRASVGLNSSSSYEDYSNYRRILSLKIYKLRKALNIQQRVLKKKPLSYKSYSPTIEDFKKDERYISLVILEIERDWATSIESQVISNEYLSNKSKNVNKKFSSAKKHSYTKLSKAFRLCKKLELLLIELTSGNENKSNLHSNLNYNFISILAYIQLIYASKLLKKKKWTQCLTYYSNIRLILENLSQLEISSDNEYSYLYTEERRRVIDPALRLCVPKASINNGHTKDLYSISLMFVDKNSFIIKSLLKINPNALDFSKDNKINIQWRDRSVSISGDLASAISNAQELSKVVDTLLKQGEEKNEKKNKSKFDLSKFDSLLSSWQNAVDVLYHDLDLFESDNISTQAIEQDKYSLDIGTKKEEFAIIETFIRFNLIVYRIQRDKHISTSGLSGKATRIERIIESIKEAKNLPGIPKDVELSDCLDAANIFYKGSRCGVVAESYHINGKINEALALYSKALKYIEDAEKKIIHNAVVKEGGLFFDKNELLKVKNNLEKLYNMAFGTCVGKLEYEKRCSDINLGKNIVINNLYEYPYSENKNIASINDLLYPSFRPLGAKPLVYDVAFNFISYPEKEVDDEQEKRDVKSGGLFGLFGRKS